MGGIPYKILQTKFKSMSFTKDDMVLEIGSENGEGSSRFLHYWAYINDISFISVDVVDNAKKRFGKYDIDFRITTSGSDWCRDELPKLNKKIKVLYLDNFDWIWKPDNIPDWMQRQIDGYASRGVVMNNANSQAEHRLQLERCLPYLHEQSVVIFDDTWQERRQLTPIGWNGKGGTCMNLLTENGYTIKEHESRCGAYAYRGTPQYLPEWLREL